MLAKSPHLSPNCFQNKMKSIYEKQQKLNSPVIRFPQSQSICICQLKVNQRRFVKRKLNCKDEKKHNRYRLIAQLTENKEQRKPRNCHPPHSAQSHSEPGTGWMALAILKTCVHLTAPAEWERSTERSRGSLWPLSLSVTVHNPEALYFRHYHTTSRPPRNCNRYAKAMDTMCQVWKQTTTAYWWQGENSVCVRCFYFWNENKLHVK